MPIYALGDVEPELPADGDYWIAPTAVLIGRVRLRPGASIWFGAVLRGDNEWIEVGERSNIQDNCVLHTDMGCPLTVGSDCVIGHRVILHGCTIGNGALVGMAATVMNRAIVGAESLVGAGALVPERREIPPRSLAIGAPVQIKRTLPDEAVRQIREGATGYHHRSRFFADSLRRID